jgi:hypothetical protein
VQEVLARVAQTVAGIKVDAERPAAPPPAPRRWRIVDRLGQQTIHEVARDSRAGITQKELAMRYGISLSSVKRLLHQPPVHQR